MIEAGSAVEIVTASIEIIKQVKKLDVVRTALVRFLPKHTVLLLGCSGTGKTNLKDSLAEVIPHAVDRLARTTRSKAYVLKIRNQYFKVIDVPGQKMSASERTQTIRDNLQSVEGILHVVCYGYHEGTNIQTDDAVLHDDSPNTTFLERNRKEEISDLIEFAKFFPGGKANWIITVISKADLWWDQCDKVLDYYTNGKYAKAVEATLNLKRGCVPYCSVIHRYYGRTRLSGIFDDKERIRLKANFIRTLMDMASKHKGKRV